MGHKFYGYVRVSSKDQNEERQIIALKNFSIPEESIYIDKASGKNFNRPQYQKMVKIMQEGDIMVIKSIDRLGRNYEEILKEWRMLTKEKKIDIVVLDIPLLDTRKNNKNLTGTFIADLVLQILSYVSQTERENIRQRQAEGIAAAKARGVQFGRPHKKIPIEFQTAREKWLSGEISSREAAKMIGVSQSTFIKWVHESKDPHYLLS